MISCDDIFRRDDMLCIAIADSSFRVKGYEVATERPAAKLYKNGEIKDIPWLGMRIYNSKRCLCFDEKAFGALDPIPATELPMSLRYRSFELLNNLADALTLIENDSNQKDYLDWNFSTLSLSSFYFLPDDSVFILPGKVSTIIDSLMSDEDKFANKEAWYVHLQANDFGKANFLFQLVYFALTGIKPYGLEDVRNTGYKPVPISLYFINNQGKLPVECEKFLKEIEHVFKMSKKDMYQVRSPYEYFKEKLTAAQKVSTPSSYIQTNSIICEDYLLKLNKRANRANFLRKKGTVLALILAAVIVIIAIAWYYIALAIAPPETAGSSKEEIVRYYYNALNDLDITKLEDSLASGCKSPDSGEVTSLYISTKTRQAYENVDSLINPQEWLDEGQPALIEGGMVYGVTNLEIEEISDTKVRATFDYYEPYDEETEEAEEFDPYTEKETSTQIARYKKVVDFTFVSKNTWLEISSIDEIECTLQEVYEVPYKENDSSVSTMLLTTSVF